MNGKETRIRPFAQRDRESVIRLWEACDLIVPWNDPSKDIDRKLLVDPDLFLVLVSPAADGLDGEELIASVMGGYEGHRGWINYLAVDPRHRGRGYARMIMDEVEERIRAKGCPKINLQIRETNKAVIEFYEHIGYTDDHIISLGKKLVDDEKRD
ncbi:MAG: GNAT family acetyltransferase [Candidatus Krumholzibacteria bacterium]|nr:GNAT family acetyltransferase [Candidatus Krumholzibacteria bacterium]